MTIIMCWVCDSIYKLRGGVDLVENPDTDTKKINLQFQMQLEMKLNYSEAGSWWGQ